MTLLSSLIESNNIVYPDYDIYHLPKYEKFRENMEIYLVMN